MEKLAASLEEGTFVKLTLSQYRGAEPGLKNLYVRPVELREGRRLAFVYRHATRDVTKNLGFADGCAAIGAALGTEFERGHLFTLTGDWEVRCDAQSPGALKASRPVFSQLPSLEHDQRKAGDPALANASFLRALGVTARDGAARPGMADKLRQIERFVEILGHLFDDSPLRERRALRVVDMGAGKGYLTFAMAEFFQRRGIDAEILGVEQRPELVEKTDHVAREHGYPRLRFEPGAIDQFPPVTSLDVLIALHACDAATDDALFYGIQSGAALLLVSPCCHKEVRAQLAPPSVLAEVLRHGILREREAELITDGIRALLLEIRGYNASVFEFVSHEHTAKNLMIAAHRRSVPLDPEPLRRRLRELFAFYGLREQRLARLLGEA